MNNEQHKNHLQNSLLMLQTRESYENYITVFEYFYEYISMKSFDIKYAKEAIKKINDIMLTSNATYLEKINKYYENIKKYFENIEKYNNSEEQIPHIFLLVGEPGSGKSYLIRNIISKIPQFQVIKKYTTRPKRNDEANVSEIECGYDVEYISNMDYTYTTRIREESNMYGIWKEDIEKALRIGKCPFVIITNEDVYFQIANDFPCQTHILEVTALDNENIQMQVFKDQDRSEEEIKNRIGVSVASWIENYEYNTRRIVNPIILHGLDKKRSENFSKVELIRALRDFGISLDLNTYQDGLIKYFHNNKKVNSSGKHILLPWMVGNYERNVELTKRKI